MDGYRRGVGIFLLNKKKELWVGKRIDFKNNYWQMPQGGIDKNETPEEAMARELGEEVGIIKNYEILMEHEKWLSYKIPDSLKKVVWNGKYIGQIQKWFVCRFYGKDKEFNLETHKPEFMEWKWIKPKEVLKFVVPFKKNLYENILKDFCNFY